MYDFFQNSSNVAFTWRDLLKYLFEEKKSIPYSANFKILCQEWINRNYDKATEESKRKFLKYFVDDARKHWKKAHGSKKTILSKTHKIYGPFGNKVISLENVNENLSRNGNLHVQKKKPKISLKCDECGIRFIKKSLPDPCLPKIPSKSQINSYMNTVIKYFENQGVEACVLIEAFKELSKRLKGETDNFIFKKNINDEIDQYDICQKDPFENIANPDTNFPIKTELVEYDEKEASEGKNIQYFVKIEGMDSISE